MRYGLSILPSGLCAGFTIPVRVHPQLFKNYPVNDGLVAHPIHHIFQDAKAFLRIAPWEGMNKYDRHSHQLSTEFKKIIVNVVK